MRVTLHNMTFKTFLAFNYFLPPSLCSRTPTRAAAATEFLLNHLKSKFLTQETSFQLSEPKKKSATGGRTVFFSPPAVSRHQI